MKTQKQHQFNYNEKFASAEQMWFWFQSSRAARTMRFCARDAGPTRRVCELLDIETLITKLYLAGQLTDEQLNVMHEFGTRRRAPNQHIYRENRAATQWRTAMNVLESAAIKKGWIE